MNGRLRTILLIVGTVAVAVTMALGIAGMPAFGGDDHPYRDLAMAAAFRHTTANAVSSVNFDQRVLDTLGEETILIAAVAGIVGILRPVRSEQRRPPRVSGRVLESTRLLAMVLFPITVLIGVDVVTHGAITPGGGFQGGVVVATGLHLLYVGGHYPVLEKLRPVSWFERTEAASLMIFVLVGLIGLFAAGQVFANVLPQGRLTHLLSSGTVPVLNLAVGSAVASSVVVLLASFLEQALVITESAKARSDEDGAAE
jgi:multicomponent Na+:H+ antiporter subunit B